MDNNTIKKVSSIIRKRIKEMPENSYTTKILRKGKVKIANKVGEEAVETISAFLYQNNSEILEESADLIFHLLILLESCNLTFNDVEKILEKRIKSD
tara:strand:- start:128 stop:418 length:291 start_codon:yes stop_codon:yes gene_type:complete